MFNSFKNLKNKIVSREKERHRKNIIEELNLPAEVEQLISTVQPFTMAYPLTIAMLHGLASEVAEEQVPGDVVECGVCNGGTAAAMGSSIQNSTKRIWLYDTFSGLPRPSPDDGEFAQSFAGQCVGNENKAIEILAKMHVTEDRIVIRKGIFAETFAQALPDQICMLHIDADWHDSVLESLRTMYPRVAPGGVVVLDDFGYWEGCRNAFYTFCHETSERPLLERIGHTQVFWKKGRQHTRDNEACYYGGWYRPDALRTIQK